MSPIQNVSNIIRIPRLGKIRLGIKVAGSESKAGYPKAVDYFVCPPEVQAVFGEKPKELAIMFPLEDERQFCQQWLRCYSLTQGLVCIGNAETARAKVDTETGEIASHLTKEWVWKDDLPCDPGECPYYLKKHCRRVMNLQFLLPSVPGLGCYQVDSTSFFSIVNINSMIRLLKGLFGRCSMIPLTLALGPVEVSPKGMKKKTIYIMHIRQDDIKLADLAKLAQLPPGRVLLPEPEVETPPDDLYPKEILQEAELEAVGKAPVAVKSPLEQDRRHQLWQAIQDQVSMKPSISSSSITAWFIKNFQIEMDSEMLAAPEPQEIFTDAALESFLNTLIDFRGKS